MVTLTVTDDEGVKLTYMKILYISTPIEAEELLLVSCFWELRHLLMEA